MLRYIRGNRFRHISSIGSITSGCFKGRFLESENIVAGEGVGNPLEYNLRSDSEGGSLSRG